MELKSSNQRECQGRVKVFTQKIKSGCRSMRIFVSGYEIEEIPVNHDTLPEFMVSTGVEQEEVDARLLVLSSIYRGGGLFGLNFNSIKSQDQQWADRLGLPVGDALPVHYLGKVDD